MNAPRLVEVAPERIERWVVGFADRHGELTWSVDGDAYLAVGTDGSCARLRTWTCASGLPPDLVRWARPPHRIGIILVRRGGYAVALAQDRQLVSHHCGTRYVQSRTAAGGWSQQRFARRRANQADDLLRTVIDKAAAMLPHGGTDALVVGGDRMLVREAVAAPQLGSLGELPRRELFDIPDPRYVVLQKALTRGRSVQITVS